MGDIGDVGNILDVLNADVTIEDAQIIPTNKDSRNIVDHLNQSITEDDVNTEHEVVEEREFEDNESDQDQITEQLGGLALLNTYTSESESDDELEILEELEKEGDLGPKQTENINSEIEANTNISENNETESELKRCDMCKSSEYTCEICKRRQGIY